MEAIYIIIIIIVFSLLAIFRKYTVYHAFMYCLALFPFVRVVVGGKGISIYAISIVLAICAIKALFQKYDNNNSFQAKGIDTFIVVMIIGGVVAFFFGVIVYNMPLMELLYGFIRTALCITTFYWARKITVHDNKQSIKLMKSLAIAVTLMTLLGILALLKVEPVLQLLEPLARNTPTFQKTLGTGTVSSLRLIWGNPNATCTGDLIVMAIIISISLFSWYLERNVSRLIMVIYIVLMIIGLILTFSRHSWIAFLVAILIFLSFEWRKGTTKISKVFVLLLILIAVSTSIYIGIRFVGSELAKGEPYSREFYGRLGIGREIDISEESRIGNLKKSIKEYAKDPLAFITGVGPGSHIVANRMINEPLKYKALYAHNYFSVFLASWGLIPLLAFLTIYALVYVRNLKVYRNVKNNNIEQNQEIYLISRIIIIVLAAIVPVMFIDHMFATDDTMMALLWFLLGIGTGNIECGLRVLYEQ